MRIIVTGGASFIGSAVIRRLLAGTDHEVVNLDKLTNAGNLTSLVPEKLIPLMIPNALEGKSLPVYGDGSNVRDWLYVDHLAEALLTVLEKGRLGETYLIGGNNERSNLEIVQTICDIMEELHPNKSNGIGRYSDLIEFVEDRPGHDLRYAIDAAKIKRDLRWSPKESLETGLRKTVKWYLDNREWWQGVLDGSYRRERLGVFDKAL